MKAVVNLEEVGLGQTYIEFLKTETGSQFLGCFRGLIAAFAQAKQSMSEYELEELTKALNYYAERNKPAQIKLPSLFGDFLVSFGVFAKYIILGVLAAASVFVLTLLWPLLSAIMGYIASFFTSRSRLRTAKAEAKSIIIEAEGHSYAAVEREVGQSSKLAEAYQHGTVKVLEV